MDTESLYRFVFTAIFVGSISISTYFRKRARASGEVIRRADEGKSFVMLRILFGLPLFLPVFAYIMNPEWLGWTKISLPEWLRILGSVTGLVCIPLVWWVFHSIGSNISETVLTKANHQLVTHGIYRWVRHPLYSVATMMFFSCGLIAGSWWIFVFAGVAIILVRFIVIPREDTMLREKFGNAYAAYQQRTGMLFPKSRLLKKA